MAVSASAADREQHRPAVQVAERHERARRGDDEPGPLQADHRDQQPDAGGNRVLDRRGNRRDQPLAQPDAGRQDEDRRRQSPRRRARRATAPSSPMTTENAKKKLCPIAGATAIGIVGEERHQRRRERRRQARRDEHGAEVHPARAQHRRLHEDDVRHRQERRERRRATSVPTVVPCAASAKRRSRNVPRSPRPSRYSARSVASGLFRSTSRLESDADRGDEHAPSARRRRRARRRRCATGCRARSG